MLLVHVDEEGDGKGLSSIMPESKSASKSNMSELRTWTTKSQVLETPRARGKDSHPSAWVPSMRLWRCVKMKHRRPVSPVMTQGGSTSPWHGKDGLRLH